MLTPSNRNTFLFSFYHRASSIFFHRASSYFFIAASSASSLHTRLFVFPPNKIDTITFSHHAIIII
jgi:hypothetical protein